MDKNGDGQLTPDELREGLTEIPDINLSQENINEAMNVID